MITPRPYQTEALDAVLKHWREGVTRQLVSLPVGSGKTLIFGMVAGALKTRTLVLAHREELLLQARQKIRLVYPEADVGILKAEERSGLRTDICVASVQTAMRNTDALRERGFRLLICDEAHHAAATSYTKIFEALGFMEGDRERLLLGVTATAYRGDNVGLGSVFEEIVFERSILAMMKAGYLCDVRGLEIKTGADISGVRTRTGDFAADELSVIIDTPERNALVADTYLRYGQGRRGVVFGVGVEHALNLAEAFRERGIPCRAVYGAMDAEERRRALSEYEAGDIRVLSNCNVLTEGWDCPEASVVMMARPTKSRGLFIQCVGRGLRTAPGKADCLLIDFVDTARKHKLCGFGTLAGDSELRPRRGKRLLEIVSEEEAAGEARRVGSSAPVQAQAVALDLLGRSRFVWTPIGSNYRLNVLDGAVFCKAVPGGYRVFRSESGGPLTELSGDVLPLDYALGVGEDYVRRRTDAAMLSKDAGWRRYPASGKQLALMKRLGIPCPCDMTRGEASELIERAFAEPLTARQRFFIQRRRLHPHPELLTKREASRLISQAKQT